MAAGLRAILLISSFAAAEGAPIPLADAVVNVPTVVSNHYRQKGAAPLPGGPGKASPPVAFEEVEEATVHRVGPGRFSALARFRAAGAKDPVWAECVVDLSRAEPGLEKTNRLEPSRAEAFRKSSAATALRQLEEERRAPPAAVTKTVGSAPKKGRRGSGPLLPTLGGERSDPTSCEAAKCLVAIVAPWCTFCRASTDKLLGLRDYLAEQEVPMRVVVGSAERDECEAYAAEFGDEAFVDPEAVIRAEAYPTFIVFGRGGRALRTVTGAPRGDDPAEIAAGFGLP